MNLIFYGLSGEGLGHASRTLSVIDSLPDCQVHVYTFGKAYKYFQDTRYPYLHRIDGIMFPYRKGKINYLGLTKRIIQYRFDGLKRNIEQISKDAEELKPSVFVTDYEPSMPRAARKLGYGNKLISVDNQHRFAYCDLSDLPFGLRLYARMTGIATRMWVPYPEHSVISTFHFDHIKTKRTDVTLTNGLLRKDIEETPATNEGFTLVYLRDSVSDIILDALWQASVNTPGKFKVYGASEGSLKDLVSQIDDFEFKPLSHMFIKDLATCDRVISTAGNQLISECRYYGKPALVVPEPGQYEQHINAHYVDKIGLGVCCYARKMNKDVVKSFLEFQNTSSSEPNGVHKVEEVIRRHF